MSKLFKCLMGFSAAFLISCGGGGGNSGSQPGVPVVKPVARFDFSLDKSAIANSGGDEVALAATALDSNNNPIPDVPFSVSVDNGIYTPAASTTDQVGKVAGKIAIGSDKTNRTIAIRMTMGGLVKETVLAVTGSQIVMATNPSAPQPNDRVELTIKVVDVNGSGIGGIPVELGGSLGFAGKISTDSGGNATIAIPAAPRDAGVYIVKATASGVTAQRDVQVVSPSGGVPDAVGVIAGASLAINPNTIPPNEAGSSINRANLKALFQDSNNKAVKNVRVRFEIVPPDLGAGERISTGSTVVYSDQNGVASAEYVSGTRTSPTNGVVIRACYANTDAEIASGKCPNVKIATMTVASSPISITLGDHNKLETGNSGLTYIKKFDIAVADAAGNAIPNAQISASVDLSRYRKADGISPSAESVQYVNGPIICKNEDTNRNGLLDLGEDINGNGAIEPRKADIVVSYVGGQTTGANGRALIQVEYAQSVAYWVEYDLKVSTNVAGSEGMVEKSYLAEALEADFPNGSFLRPLYGRGGCEVRP